MTELLANLMRSWRVVQRREGIRPDCCILATRTGIAVLAEHGDSARPYTCRLLVFNNPAMELWESGVPVPEWPDHAWSIGVGMDEFHQPGRWNGHMMLHVGEELVDLSASQLHRPGLIEVDGPLLMPYVRDTGVSRFGPVWILVQHTNQQDYRHANDWRKNWQDLAPKVLAEMEGQ